MSKYLYLIGYPGDRHEDCHVCGLYTLEGLEKKLTKEVNEEECGSYYIFKMKEDQDWYEINRGADCNVEFMWDTEEKKKKTLIRLKWTIKELNKLEDGKYMPNYPE